ncbi:MAG TPA: L,D-transpeptidase family protein [Acidimicrobiales bacterium]|nr:L,D-transpeptidase family protein [Acidimicrobiales bacterium]
MRHRLTPRIAVTGVVVVVGALGAFGAAVGLAGSGSRSGAASVPSSAQPSPLHGGMELVTADPASGSSSVLSDSGITLRFSRTLSAASPMPMLTPMVAGTWSRPAADTLHFQPSDGFAPGASEVLTVPGGGRGVRADDGSVLRHDVSVSFVVAPMAALRLQQLLASLDYLPVSFDAAGPTPATDAMAMAQPGTFAWRWPTLPASFTSLWTPGSNDIITKGAVMAFEAQHGLGADGIAGPEVWAALLVAATAGATDPDPYDWVDVSTTVPESVTVWRDGAAAYSTPANTGVEGAVTAVGTWPVFARYTSTTMKGTNPDGTTYDDPGVPWVSYFHGGDALHGFQRASYGTPQSLGCVEMPPANAALVYPYTPLGTLVTIE